ncbi:MAG: hypoxanthine phosphoribosyltransferase [Bacteroidota bacterium]|nr:hypoxanthine phosphoribosyltransferase [Bacteroidota bacterium]
MEPVKVHDKYFTPYLSSQLIAEKVSDLAAQINSDYCNKKPLLIGILNGSFMFAADLFRQLTIEAKISFIKLASYQGTKSSGKVITAIGLDTSISGRDVIIIEDIIDTGKTLQQFLPQLQSHQPLSLAVAVLLHKPQATVFAVDIHYKCFTIPDKFVVGYGLDYDGWGRNLPAIYQLQEE